MSRASKSSSGFTIVEVVLVCLLVSIIATMTVSLVKTNSDGLRYEQTRSQMDALKVAILGDDSVNAQGHRVNFGYLGDWGGLPGTLNNLVVSQLPAWSFNTTYGIGAGWKGPYLNPEMSTLNVSLDAWGTALNYLPGAAPPSVTSYGADRVVSGTGLNQDLVMNFPNASFNATVSGTVVDRGTAINGAVVEMRYPSNGSIVTTTQTSIANGSFTFPAIPYGIRSIGITSTPTLGPFQIVVDAPKVQIPQDVLDYHGTGQRITMVAASRTINLACAAGNGSVCVNVNNTYSAAQVVQYVTLSWSQAGLFLKTAKDAGVGITLQQCLPSGSRLDVTTQVTAISIATGVTTLSFTFFNNTACGVVTAVAATTVFDLTLEYSGQYQRDTMQF